MQPATEPILGEPATRQRGKTAAIIAVLCLTGTAVSLPQTMVVPLLPEFPEVFGVSHDDSSWLITITLLTGAVGTPIISRLADMFGKRRMLLLAVWAMIVGSLVAAVSGTFAAAVIGRGLQGLSVSLVPVGISIMRDELPKARVAGSIALMSATLGIGAALALPLAGFIDAHLGWQGIFWVPAGIGAVMFAAAALIIPESSVRTRGRFDFLGAILLSGGLSTLLVGITKGGTWGWSSTPTLVLFGTSVLFFGLWFPYELRVGNPLVDLRTSAQRPVLATNIASVLVGFVMYANLLLTTQQLQMPQISGYGLEMTAFAAGVAMIPTGVAMVVFSPVSALITNRFGPRITLITGAMVMAVAYLSRVVLAGSIPVIVIGATLVSIGTAITYAAMPMLIMRSVPITETASANGLNSLLRSIGTSISSAFVAAILTTMTVKHGPSLELPSPDAFDTMYAAAVLFSLLAASVALAIPRQREVSVGADVGHLDADESDSRAVTLASGVFPGTELLVTGMVTDQTGIPVRQAVISLLDTSGRPVDWSRSGSEGKFSLVLPAAGRYLMIASADGWTPHSEVVGFADAIGTHLIMMRQRLTLSGRLRSGGPALSGGLVTLTKPTGEFVSSAFSDADGQFDLPLPSVGRYILTALDPAREDVLTRQVAIIGASATVDLDLRPTLTRIAMP
ncbi:MFS family permease [Rhodococcus sp. 27YEA15]|uniref:MFS transporter n=1 Tax=Rhodococcus sp. 27YEA15 TaxID=3156259 RepID=UPI003C7AB9F5